jgi:hypothetical protein
LSEIVAFLLTYRFLVMYLVNLFFSSISTIILH